MREAISGITGFTICLCAALGSLTACSDESPSRATSTDATSPPPLAAVEEDAYLVPPRQPGEFLAPQPLIRDARSLEVRCAPVSHPPVLDGRSEDTAWKGAVPVKTLDLLSQRTVELRSVHHRGRIFVLARWPDDAESVTHRSFRWDQVERFYLPASDREDGFVMKWAVDGDTDPAALILAEGRCHRADVWFWKACRTNPVGHADDKHQTLGEKRVDRAREMPAREDRSLWLSRLGDRGRSSYSEEIPRGFRGPYVPRFRTRPPEGSRADVAASGAWRNGFWTLELARDLDTGHDDDVSFGPGGRYAFVISLYEIAGRPVDGKQSQPLYGAGDGFDRLTLHISSKGGTR